MAKRRRILEKFSINEISGVDRPCQEGALVTIMKREQSLAKRKVISMKKAEAKDPSTIAALDAILKDIDGAVEDLRKGETARVLKRADAALALVKKPTFFSAETRRDLADSGAAMEDGSFPIRNKKDLVDAIHSIGRANNPDKVKAHIKTRARALGASDMIPEGW